MKNIIKKIGKSVAIQIAAFSIIVGGVAIAVSFPTSTPIGQTAGGKFMGYFNNLFTPCPTGQVMIKIKSDGTPECSLVGPNFLSTSSVTQTKVLGGYVDLTTTQNISGVKTFKGNGGKTTMNIPAASDGTSLPPESAWPAWGGGLRTWDILAASIKLIGGIVTEGGIQINNTAPILYLQDTNHKTAMLHANSNNFYILSGNTGSTTATPNNGWWPMTINLENNKSYFGGDMAVNGTITASAPTATNHVATKAYVDTKRDNNYPISGNFFRGTPGILGDGVMEIGKYIDFHNSNTTTADYTARLRNEGSDLILDGGGKIKTFGGELATKAYVDTKASTLSRNNCGWYEPYNPRSYKNGLQEKVVYCPSGYYVAGVKFSMEPNNVDDEYVGVYCCSN